MTVAVEGRVARARRERLLTQFVDRSAEMDLFKQVLDSQELPIMVVSAAVRVNDFETLRHGV